MEALKGRKASLLLKTPFWVLDIWEFAHLHACGSHRVSCEHKKCTTQGHGTKSHCSLPRCQAVPQTHKTKAALLLSWGGLGNRQLPKGKCKRSRKSCKAADQPPPTPHLFPRIPSSLECPVRELECHCLCPKTVLLLRLIKTKAAIGLSLPECNPPCLVASLRWPGEITCCPKLSRCFCKLPAWRCWQKESCLGTNTINLLRVPMLTHWVLCYTVLLDFHRIPHSPMQ